MKSRLVNLAGGMILAGSMLFVTAGVAAAAGPVASGPSGSGVCATEAAAVKAGATVDTLRAFGDCEIGRRFTTLSDLASKISASKTITSSDAAALQSEISSTTAGLTSLKATIDAETSMPALRADIVKIAADYRVYLLVVPQAWMVNAADTVVSVQSKFATINTDLTARIAAAKAAGKDTTTAQADLDAMNASVTAAVGLASPLPAQLLPLTPAEYNGGTAGPVLTAARTALGTARDDLKSAIASAKACRDALN